MPKINVSPVELWALRKIFEAAGWEVISPEEQVTLYDLVKQTADGQAALSAKFDALDFATLSGHLDAIATGVNGLSAGQTVEQADLDGLKAAASAAKAELDSIQADLQPSPTPNP